MHLSGPLGSTKSSTIKQRGNHCTESFDQRLGFPGFYSIRRRKTTRYQSGPDQPKKAKKKKNKEKPRSLSTGIGVLVVDEDPVWQKLVQLEDFEEEDKDEFAGKRITGFTGLNRRCQTAVTWFSFDPKEKTTPDKSCRRRGGAGQKRSMGRRKKDGSDLKPGICKGATLREENLGKKEVDVSSILKIKHLQKLAVWAGGEGGIPSLGAFFGYHLAANAELLGVPLDKSSFFCQRCESDLQPGFNCTIRIEKCKNGKRRRSNKKSCNLQNNVIYTCNFCHHRNSIKGTMKGHIKTLKESRSDSASESKLHSSLRETTVEKLQNDGSKCISITKNDSTAGDYSDRKMPVTPPQNSTVLSKKKRKLSELEPGKAELSSSSSKGSSRRKRKTWSSLKDVVERKEAESKQNASNYVIPFFMQAE